MSEASAFRQETWERRLEKLRRLVSVRSWWPFFRFAPPGHFYSPIPDLREVDRDAARLFAKIQRFADRAVADLPAHRAYIQQINSLR